MCEFAWIIHHETTCLMLGDIQVHAVDSVPRGNSFFSCWNMIACEKECTSSWDGHLKKWMQWVRCAEKDLQIPYPGQIQTWSRNCTERTQTWWKWTDRNNWEYTRREYCKRKHQKELGAQQIMCARKSHSPAINNIPCRFLWNDVLKFPFRHEERHSALKKLGITAYSSQNPFPSRNRFYPAIFVAFDLETLCEWEQYKMYMHVCMYMTYAHTTPIHTSATYP